MNESKRSESIQPILVVLVWRGGARFQRALDSIRPSEKFFKRVVFSITSTHDSEDMRIAEEYLRVCTELGDPSKAEVICSGEELSTMQHQDFWIDYLETTGAKFSDWICWLAYDDEIRLAGLEAITDSCSNWNLSPSSVYLGPWLIRHEGADELWSGDPKGPLEEWTCFNQPHLKPISTQHWISEQFSQPTYIQMSGSIAPLRNHAWLVRGPIPKTNPMRIEMATTLSGEGNLVTELPEAITIIYGRPNSDRASYGSSARSEDWHLVKLLAKKSLETPSLLPVTILCFARGLKRAIANRIRGYDSNPEEWKVRSIQTP